MDKNTVTTSFSKELEKAYQGARTARIALNEAKARESIERAIWEGTGQTPVSAAQYGAYCSAIRARVSIQARAEAAMAAFERLKESELFGDIDGERAEAREQA